MTGTLKQSSGVVKWNDVPIKSLGKKYRKILGYMPQQQNLYDTFTGRKFLLYMCTLKEIKKEDAAAETEKAAARLNLTDQLDKRLGAFPAV